MCLGLVPCRSCGTSRRRSQESPHGTPATFTALLRRNDPQLNRQPGAWGWNPSRAIFSRDRQCVQNARPYLYGIHFRNGVFYGKNTGAI